MGNYEQLKQAVSDVIKTNGNQEITGAILQNTLLSIISTVGSNATFAGIATPSTIPGTPDANVFYLASKNGIYVNFNNIELNNEIAIIDNKNGNWVKTTTGFATNDGIGNVIGIDNVDNRPIYANSIKFIAFVPKEEYKDNTFGIYALSAYTNQASPTPKIVNLDLWLLNFEESQAQGKEVNAVKLQLSSGTDITRPTFARVNGNAGTLYVIIDWVPIVNYKNNQGLYSCVVWGANFTNPNYSNLVIVQKIKDNDPRILNWDECVEKTKISDDYGISKDKILTQFRTSSIIGIQPGLSFYFDSRFESELKAMQIIKRAYFSFKNGTEKEIGIGVLGNGGGDGSKFWFGFGYLDGTGSGLATIPLIPNEDIPTGVKSYYVENQNCKFYVEIDFEKWREIGNVVWNWSTPCCKFNNVIPNDSIIWNELLANEIQNENNEAYAFTEAFSPYDLDEGYCEVSNGKVRVSSNIPDRYRHIKIDLKDIKRMRITLDPHGAVVYAAIYTDWNDNYISRELKGNDKTEIYTNYELTIPSNARYVYISGYYLKIGDLNPGVMAYKYVYNAQSEYEASGFLKNGLNWNNVNVKNNVVDIVNKAIKFIAFVPKEEYKNNQFTINALGCYSNNGSETFGALSFNLWVFDTSGSNIFGARYTNNNVSEFNYNYPDIIKVDGERGTLYAIVDWNILRGYYSKYSNKWVSVYWDTSFENKPIVQLLTENDPRILNWGNSNNSPTRFGDLSVLNFGVDGDSITAGNEWSYYAAQELKFATHHNVAVGSATFGDREASSSEGMKYTQNYDDPDFAGISSGWQPTDDPIEIQKRCNNCARVHVQKFISEVTAGTYPIPDIFVFAMGTNDGTIGTIEDALNGKDANDLSAEVRRTMAGGARWAIQKIIETYPNCRVYVSAPIQRADETANEKGLQKTDILRGICNGLSVGFFNTFGECGITEKLETGTGRYLRDGFHPDTEGQKLMGRYLAKEIRNNYF